MSHRQIDTILESGSIDKQKEASITQKPYYDSKTSMTNHSNQRKFISNSNLYKPKRNQKTERPNQELVGNPG